MSFTFLPSSPPFAVLPPFLLSLTPSLSSPYTFSFPFSPLILLRSYDLSNDIVMIICSFFPHVYDINTLFPLSLYCSCKASRFDGVAGSIFPPPLAETIGQGMLAWSMPWRYAVPHTRAFHIINHYVPIFPRFFSVYCLALNSVK